MPVTLKLSKFVRNHVATGIRPAAEKITENRVVAGRAAGFRLQIELDRD